MSRERLKTIVLSILVIMSILLTHQIWLYSPNEVLTSKALSNKSHTLEIRENIISPKRIILGFGGGIQSGFSTILSHNEMEEVWQYSRRVLEDYFILEPEITEISAEDYTEYMGLRHVELEFGDNISSVLVSSIFNNIDSKIVRNIREINKILIPSINKGSIFIVGKDNNTFEIKLKDYVEDKSINDFMIEYEANGFIKYYRLFSFVDNYTLMPPNFYTQLPKLTVESVLDVEKDQVLQHQTEIFFDRNLDFVRIIKETNGAVVFLYGYGEKTLRISPTGRLEYNEEISNESSTNVIAALDTAIDFIDSHGVIPKTAYLAEAKQIKKGNSSGYYFGFNYFIDGYPVAISSKNMKYPIEIEVFGNCISSYKSFVRTPMLLPNITRLEPIRPPHKVIESNIDIFEIDTVKDGNLLEEMNKNNEILRRINSIQMVYFDTMEEKRRQIVVPAWQIKVNNQVYYFDSYKGQLLYKEAFN